MVDRNRFIINNADDNNKITQQWSLHAQVTLTQGKPNREYELQRGNITFTSKPSSDSGYSSSQNNSQKFSYFKNNKNVASGLSASEITSPSQSSCKVILNCNHLYPHHTALTLTTNTNILSSASTISTGSASVTSEQHGGLCEICTGLGSHSPTTQRRKKQFTSHFCTRVPDKKINKILKDKSIQTSMKCIPDLNINNGKIMSKVLTESSTLTDSNISTSPPLTIQNVSKCSEMPSNRWNNYRYSSSPPSTSSDSTPCTVLEVMPLRKDLQGILSRKDIQVTAQKDLQINPLKQDPQITLSQKDLPLKNSIYIKENQSRFDKSIQHHPSPLTKQKRQTLSSGSLRKSPNILMHSSTTAVEKYSNILSPTNLKKLVTPNYVHKPNENSYCDTMNIINSNRSVGKLNGDKNKNISNSSIGKLNNKGKLKETKTDLNESVIRTDHSIKQSNTQMSLDSLKNSFSSICSDISQSDTNGSIESDTSSTISCTNSFSTDSMSDTSSTTLDGGSVSRSNSFEYADSFEYDDSFDKLRIEEKEKTWKKKSTNGETKASINKDEIRRQKFDEYLMKRSTTSPLPSWNSSTMSITTINSFCSESSSSSSSSSVSEDGSMSELGWSFASKCNNPTRLNSVQSLNSISSLFDLKKSNRKLGPQKIDSLDSGSYSDSSQQTFCSRISVRETSEPREILNSKSSSFSKAEIFGPVINAMKKPGHHIGISKNPNCNCDTCYHYFKCKNKEEYKKPESDSSGLDE